MFFLTTQVIALSQSLLPQIVQLIDSMDALVGPSNAGSLSSKRRRRLVQHLFIEPLYKIIVLVWFDREGYNVIEINWLQELFHAALAAKICKVAGCSLPWFSRRT